MSEKYTPATELDVYERVASLTSYLTYMVSCADNRTFPGDDYLDEVQRFIDEIADEALRTSQDKGEPANG